MVEPLHPCQSQIILYSNACAPVLVVQTIRSCKKQLQCDARCGEACSDLFTATPNVSQLT